MLFFAVEVKHMIFLSFGWLISRESVLHYEGFTRRRLMCLVFTEPQDLEDGRRRSEYRQSKAT